MRDFNLRITYVPNISSFPTYLQVNDIKFLQLQEIDLSATISSRSNAAKTILIIS